MSEADIRNLVATGFLLCVLGACGERSRQTVVDPVSAPRPRAGTGGTVSENRELKSVYEAAVAKPHDEAAFQRFVDSLPTDGDGNYIVEGDLVLSKAQLRMYLEDLGRDPAPATRAGELTLALDDSGNPSYWRVPDRHLRYWVDRASFRTNAEAQATADRLRDATRDWVNACPGCGITFEDIPSQTGATFVVRYRPGPRPVARSFFPHTAPSERVLLVFDPFFSSGMTFDPVGVLRHELGHVLGYRHEHIRGPEGKGVNGCYVEDDRWLAIGPYDSKSVMHYLCGGAGDSALILTGADKLGHACVYKHGGPPCPGA
jgi:hypothetical protein